MARTSTRKTNRSTTAPAKKGKAKKEAVAEKPAKAAKKGKGKPAEEPAEKPAKAAKKGKGKPAEESEESWDEDEDWDEEESGEESEEEESGEESEEESGEESEEEESGEGDDSFELAKGKAKKLQVLANKWAAGKVDYKEVNAFVQEIELPVEGRRSKESVRAAVEAYFSDSPHDLSFEWPADEPAEKPAKGKKAPAKKEAPAAKGKGKKAAKEESEEEAEWPDARVKSPGAKVVTPLKRALQLAVKGVAYDVDEDELTQALQFVLQDPGKLYAELAPTEE